MVAAEGDGPPRFEMQAYNADSQLRVRGFDAPVVVELKSASFEKPVTKINRNHDQSREIGHTTDQRIDAAGVYLEGILSVPGEDRSQILEASENGFPWDASIEASFPPAEYVSKRKSVVVNGQRHSGVYVARNSVITGVAIVSRGADRQTSVSIAAEEHKGKEMKPELKELIASQGFDPDVVADNPQQLQHFEAQLEDSKKSTEQNVEASTEKWEDWVQDQRDRTAAESERIRDITRICAEHNEPETADDAGNMVSLAAHAIKNNWTSKETLLEAKLFSLEAKSNGHTPAIHVAKDLDEQESVIECSLALGTGQLTESDIKAHDMYSEKVVNEATSKKYRGYTVSRVAHDLMAAANVYHPQGRLDNDYLEACVKAHRKLQASGFTTMSLPGVLSNVMNKTLMAAYMRAPSFIPFVFGQVSARDFKPIYSFQVEGTGMLEELGQDGQIKHGGITESQYELAIKTYAKKLTFTRKMMIDDDLNSLARVSSILGQYAFKAREYAATQVIVNSTMFHADNGNLLTANPLSISGLTASGVAFDAQTDYDGLPISVDGGNILAPASLKVITSQLQNQTEIRNTDGTIADNPYTNNPHAGTFQAFNTQWLDNSIASAVAGVEDANRSNTWYRFADPQSAPAFQVAYLNGQSTPTVQSSDSDFNTLGMSWRCIFDYGFGECDKKFAQKNVGV